MLAGRKSFGEKVARDMEDSWAAATGQRIALVSPGEGVTIAQQARPVWPFRAPYDDYMALPQGKKEQLDSMVSGFIAGAAPPIKSRVA